MPKSIVSFQSVEGTDSRDDGDYDTTSLEQREQDDTVSSATPTSPTLTFRKAKLNRPSDIDLSRHAPTERSSLLGHTHGSRSYMSMPASMPGTPRPPYNRHSSQNRTRNERLRHSRTGSFSHNFSQRLVNALGSERRAALGAKILRSPYTKRG